MDKMWQAKQKRDEDAAFNEEVDRGFMEYKELEKKANEVKKQIADLEKERDLKMTEQYKIKAANT